MPFGRDLTNTRPLHFIWICDCSGSMSQGGKIQALNNGIREAIPLMQQEAAANPFAKVLVRCITFSSGAQWHIAQPTPVEEFKWVDLTANGVTDMGKALSMVADQLKSPPMTDRALPPVLVLISDGQPTDDFNTGLKQLMEQPWAKKAVRISISIGVDADRDVLQKFIGHPEMQPLQANNTEDLVRQIKWASTAIKVGVGSMPITNTPDGPIMPPIPTPAPTTPVGGNWDSSSADDDVW